MGINTQHDFLIAEFDVCGRGWSGHEHMLVISAARRRRDRAAILLDEHATALDRDARITTYPDESGQRRARLADATGPP